MMMINYRNLAGGEVSYWNGIIYFWMPDGVYTVQARTIKKYSCSNAPRHVILTLKDNESDFVKKVTRTFGTELDDFELIHRFISGSSSCDCIRGELIYGPTLNFECNKGPNRFTLQKMVIKGESSKCVLEYKEYR